MKEKNINLFKNHFLTVIESSLNPMLNRSRNKIRKDSNYFVQKNGVISPIRLKKSDVLKLIDDNNSKGVEDFITNNKLSYKQEQDVKRILEHIYN